MSALDPFSGTWKLNSSKSQLPWPAPQSSITYTDSDLDGVRVREEIVRDREYAVTLQAKFDGEDYPVAGSPFADSIAYRRIDEHTIAGVIKMAGEIVVRETVVISADGMKMTNTYFGNGSQDVSIGFAVFDKR